MLIFLRIQGNPMAVGHKISHPPRGETPKCVLCPLDIPVSLFSEYNHLVPNLPIPMNENHDFSVIKASILDSVLSLSRSN